MSMSSLDISDISDVSDYDSESGESDTDSEAYMDENQNDTSAVTVFRGPRDMFDPDISDELQSNFENGYRMTHQMTNKQYLIEYVFANNWGTKTETEDNLNNLETMLTAVTVETGIEAFNVNMFYGAKWILFKQLYTKYRQDIHLSEVKEIVVMKFMVDILGIITFRPQSSESTFQPQFTTHFTTQPLRF